MNLWTVSHFSEKELREIGSRAREIYGEEAPRKILFVFNGNSQAGIDLAVNGGAMRVKSHEGGESVYLPCVTKEYPKLVEQTKENVKVFVFWRDELTGVPIWGILVEDYALEGTSFRSGSVVVYDGMFLREYNVVARRMSTQAMRHAPQCFAHSYIAEWIPWSDLAGVYESQRLAAHA